MMISTIYSEMGFEERKDEMKRIKWKRLLGLVLVVILTICSVPISGLADEEQAKKFKETVVSFAGGDGTEKNPYQVANAEQLNAIRDNLQASYSLISDIDLSEWQNWNPIGLETGFSGTFNGQGFTIRGLKIGSGKIRSGLFGCVLSDGKIENLHVITSGIYAGGYTGGILVGTNHGTISKCNVEGDIDGNWWSTVWELKEKYTLGGIAGYSTGRIEFCTFMNGSMNGVIAGGIVGYNEGEVYGCYTSGDIEGSCDSNGLAICGGIAGRNRGTISYCSSSSYVHSIVSSAGCAAGGIAGNNMVRGNITYCYFDGTLFARATPSNYGNPCGGIVGSNGDRWLKYGGAISNCVSCAYEKIYGCDNYGSIDESTNYVDRESGKTIIDAVDQILVNVGNCKDDEEENPSSESFAITTSPGYCIIGKKKLIFGLYTDLNGNAGSEAKSIEWVSSAPEIAEVSLLSCSSGSEKVHFELKITGHKAGIATITGTAEDGRSVSFEISVEPELQFPSQSDIY